MNFVKTGYRFDWQSINGGYGTPDIYTVGEALPEIAGLMVMHGPLYTCPICGGVIWAPGIDPVCAQHLVDAHGYINTTPTEGVGAMLHYATGAISVETPDGAPVRITHDSRQCPSCYHETDRSGLCGSCMFYENHHDSTGNVVVDDLQDHATRCGCTKDAAKRRLPGETEWR